jgi:hypothetical protein
MHDHASSFSMLIIEVVIITQSKQVSLACVVYASTSTTLYDQCDAPSVSIAAHAISMSTCLHRNALS